MRKKVIWVTVSCLIVAVLVIVLWGRIPGIAPVSGGAGKSREDAVPLGTPLAVTLYRGVQELTVLGAEYQESEFWGLRPRLSVQVRIRAITDTEYCCWDFKAFGSNGVLYECGGIPVSTEIVAGTSKVEQLTFSIEEGDIGEFFLVWDASIEDGIDRRYFSLE